MEYIRTWFRNFWDIFTNELKQIFSDGGVLIIFFVAGVAYPILYNLIYHNGVLNNTPVAVVDMCDCAESREYVREVDATREVRIARHCTSMEEAEKLMQRRKVNGIIYIPEDFDDCLNARETANISVYADMSSFLYYKNALIGTELVMLHQIGDIQIKHYLAEGKSVQEAEQLVQAIPYEENNPWNRANSYAIFFISAALLVIIQQTMFYGEAMLSGTMREENRSYAQLPATLQGRGVSRVVFGRGAAYWLLYMGIGIYIACIVPAMFGLPQRGSFWDVLVLLVFFVTDCVFYASFWSSFFTRREIVFVLFLFISPICLFLTGFSWPTTAFPEFWKIFSYLFPTTFGCQAFINVNTAGGDLHTIKDLLIAMNVQMIVYYVLSCVAIHVENWIVARKEEKSA